MRIFKPFIAFFTISVAFATAIPQTAWAANAPLANTHDATTLSLPLEDLQRLAAAINEIKHYYIEPVDDKKLFEYAIQGMLANLDPHSDYLDASSLKDLEMTTTGKFGGIGIEVVPDNGLIRIIAPIDDTPASKAGVKAGDLIVRINNKLVGDMTLREAIDIIRGEPGSTVHLTILRKNEKKPVELNIEREIIKIQTVKSELYDNDFGYIRLSFFQNETKRDLVNAISQLKEKTDGHLQGVILDLRNNPGGLLDAAVNITNMFLDSKHLKYNNLIVYTKGRAPSSDIKAQADGTDQLKGIPMVVLINGGSASASEIVAGALQDQKRATVVGEKSFGKGSVQTVLPIDDHSAMKLTTALYYTPAGRSIQAKGIVPDIRVADVKIPKPEQGDDTAFAITEMDLNKHLANGNNKTADGDKEKQLGKKSGDLLNTDFQLFQALEILKGLHAFSTTQTS